MDTFFNSVSKESLLYLGIALVCSAILYGLLSVILKRLGKDPNSLLPLGSFKRLAMPLGLIFFSILIRMESFREVLRLENAAFWFKKAGTLLFIFAATWLVITLLKIVKNAILTTYSSGDSKSFKARQVYTQFTVLEHIVIFVVIILATGLALMSFKEIRELGISIFASAGVAGIIIGFSAQKFIGSIIAGIQIAIAQPIKLDDVVVVEGEWGNIEEITLTYVVVKIWDKRRLIVPTTYFIDQPFENWTKTSSDILGTVFLYVDYRVSFDELREEFKRILQNTELWDGKVNTLQVTDTKPNYVEARALMSAKDSSTLWELRVYVREKLLVYLQKQHPESIVKTRIMFPPAPQKEP